MNIRVAATALAIAPLLAIASCDSRDYEAEIAALETDVQSARGEADQMRTEIEELRAQAEVQPDALPEGAIENVQAELNSIMQTASATFAQMGTMTQEPDAAPDQRTEALGVLREDMQKIVQSVQAAATDLGLELETVAMDTDADAMEGTASQPEPAAGPDTQPQEPAATEEQPTTAQ
jgi:predicted  nucleic acid-binding Zn-ribbon protein